MKHYFLLALVAIVLPLSASADKDIEATYNASCAICHVSGVAGAPKTGDHAAWDIRLEKGMDALVVSVQNGLNAMPPTGMCADCSAEDFKALIHYMYDGKIQK